MEEENAQQLNIEVEDRYHRQRLIAWWEQERIQDAHILVIGAGALGNEILKTLALVGAGNIVVYDMDKIELSNLSRAILFTKEDEGKYKSQVAAKRIKEINPDINTIGHVGDITATLGLGMFIWADVIICGLDNRIARMFVNRACAWTGRKWVDGAIEGLAGVVRAFDPKNSVCYECTMNETDYRLVEERMSCAMIAASVRSYGYVPNTAVAAGIVGSLQAQEAIKILHDQSPLIGQGFLINGLWNAIDKVNYPRKEDCPGHDYFGPFKPLGFGVHDITLAELLSRAESALGKDTVLDLSRDIVLRFECPQCGDQSHCGKVLGTVTEREAACPHCGTHRALYFISSISHDDDIDKSLTFADIGVPPYDGIIARQGLEKWQAWYFDGDSQAVLGTLDTARGTA